MASRVESGPRNRISWREYFTGGRYLLSPQTPHIAQTKMPDHRLLHVHAIEKRAGFRDARKIPAILL